MFIAALFTIAKIWKQTKHPSMDERTKKMWNIYITVVYYSAMKKINKISSFPTTWTDLEGILSEISQRKTNTIWSHFICGI